ncbi:MAG: glycosyltransferase [Pseudonocardia sp.]
MAEPVRGRVLVAHPSADLYGSDRVLLETVAALVDAGWQVVVTVPAGGPLCDALEQRGARVMLCPAPVLRKSALRPAGFVRLVVESLRATVAGSRLIRTVDPAVVYVNTVTIPLWILLARAWRRPVVSHVHEAEGSASGLLRRALAAPQLLASAVVTNSEFSTNVLATSFPRLRRRAEVVYNAVPGPPSASPPRPVVVGALRLLYVGRLSQRKGVDVAVEAVSLLAERGVEVDLDLVGEVFPGYEWYREDLEAQVARAGLGERVHLRGFQPVVWPWLADADAVLVPSRADEPFGNTAVEAMLATRPAVVSDTSGLREAARGYRGVRYVAPGDPVALADGVAEVLDSWPALVAGSRADADLAAARHGTATYGARVVGIVERVAAAGPRRRQRAPEREGGDPPPVR